MKLFLKLGSSIRAYSSITRTGSLVAVVLVLCVTAFGNEKALHQAQKALRTGDYQRAEQLFREILQKDDSDAEAHLGLSKTLLKQQRLRESFEHAARVIATNPLSAEAHAILGSAILATGDFRLSLEEFRTALNIDDNQALAVAGLAMIDFYENRNTQAVEKLRRAVSMDEEEPDYVFSLGQAAARAEKYQEAADAYERFLRETLFAGLRADVYGFRGGWALRRRSGDEEEFLVMTLFESLDAVRAFAGDDYETPVIEPSA